MTTGTLLFVHLIPRIPRGELKSIFFSLIFFGLTRQTSPTACTLMLLPSSIFFPNVVVSTGLSETKIMYPLNKKAYDIIHPWLRLTCSAKFYHS